MPPVAADQEIEADLAGADEANLLGSPPAIPGAARRTTTTRRGQPIEFAVSLYRRRQIPVLCRLVRDLE